MYFLHDLYAECANQPLLPHWTAAVMTFSNEEKLLDFWRRRIGDDFSQLNVTGNDTYAANIRYATDQFNRLIVVGADHFTRRFLVTDNYDRKIDIRDWGEPVALPVKWSRFWGAYFNGRKYNKRRAHGPSMHRRMLAIGCDSSAMELDNGEIVTVPGLRKKAVLTFDEQDKVYERRYWRRDTPRSWKDQTKSRTQYNPDYGRARRMRRQEPCEPWKYLAADGFAIDRRLLAE